MRRSLVCVFLLAVVQNVPSGVASSSPVDGCSTECDPIPVNDGQTKILDEPVDVILYAHIKSLDSWSLLNTQPPGSSEGGENGFFTTLPSVDTRTGLCGSPCADIRWKNNEHTMRTTAGRVTVLEDGTWAVGGHRGLALQARLTGEPLRAYWYMSADAAPGDNVEAGIIAGLRLSARLGRAWDAQDSSVYAASRDDGPVLSSMTALPGGRTVYEFLIELDVDEEAWKGMDPDDGLSLTVDWRQAEVGSVAEASQRDWRIHAGASFAPRIILPMQRPVDTVAATLTHHDGSLYARWTFRPVLGSYDVDDASLRLDVVQAPTQAPVEIDHIHLHRSIDCRGDIKPLVATWAIPYRDAALADGQYVLRASILNAQETYRKTHDFTFNVTNGIPEGATVFNGTATVPGLDPPLLGLGVVGAALLVAVRRRHPSRSTECFNDCPSHGVQ